MAYSNDSLIAEGAQRLLKSVDLPQKILLGPGPTNLPESVKQALTWPALGHLHPEFVSIMDDIKAGLQYVFDTTNKVTFAVSGTGHLGMECAMINIIEPGTKVLVLKNGIWGERASNLARNMGADVTVIEKTPGLAFDVAEVEQALVSHKPKLLFSVYGESSTGVLQPMEGLGAACHKHDCLLLVDTVASLCAAPFHTDKWEVDIVYTATQKAISAPTGLAPISFSDRAWKVYQQRKTPVPSFYLDIGHLSNYWGCFGEPRKYHHTGIIQLNYALREALSLIARETVEKCVQRHQQNTLHLHKLLQERLGLKLFVDDSALRNPAVTTVAIPDSHRDKWQAVIGYLMKEYKIEIAGGLGDTVGKVWRIGLMGVNSNEENVNKVVDALEQALKNA